MMKKIINTITLVIAFVFMLTINPLYTFAAEIPQNIENEVPTTVESRASSSFTWALKVGQGYIVNKTYLGFNPTVKVTARGNSNMVYKVWVVNPVGIKGDVGVVRADGSSISKNLWMSVGGEYFIYVEPWGGSTNGQTVYFDFNVTW